MIRLYATDNASGFAIYTAENFVEIMRLARKLTHKGLKDMSMPPGSMAQYNTAVRLAGKMCSECDCSIGLRVPNSTIIAAAKLLRYTAIKINSQAGYFVLTKYPDAVALIRCGYHVSGLSRNYEDEWVNI